MYTYYIYYCNYVLHILLLQICGWTIFSGSSVIMSVMDLLVEEWKAGEESLRTIYYLFSSGVHIDMMYPNHTFSGMEEVKLVGPPSPICCGPGILDEL